MDIIVFPEYGITGTNMGGLPLSQFQEYCQTIPSIGTRWDCSKNTKGMVCKPIYFKFHFEQQK